VRCLRLELGNRFGYLPSELSVGQQQRVAVARAMVHGPAIVFADEPTGDVDPETAKTIMDCLVGLVLENRTAFIVCTHGEFPPETADQHYLLQDGRMKAVSVVPSTVGRCDLQPLRPAQNNGHSDVPAVTGESRLRLFLRQKLTEVLAAEKVGK